MFNSVILYVGHIYMIIIIIKVTQKYFQYDTFNEKPKG